MYRRNFCKLGVTGLGALAISKQVDAAELFTKAAAKKWAIVYGSQCGSTRDYANAINEGLGSIADVIDIATSTPKVDDYDYFVIGGWRNGDKVEPSSIPKFIKDNKAALKEKIKGLFVVLGNGGKTTMSSTLTNFLKQYMITPAGVSEDLGKVFFGKSDPNCNKLTISYDNVKKSEGVAFGNKILADATGIIAANPSSLPDLKLSCLAGLSRQISNINYTLPHSGPVELSICSLHGQKLSTLVSQHQNAGSYQVKWDQSTLAPGFYLYRLQFGKIVETRTTRIFR